MDSPKEAGTITLQRRSMLDSHSALTRYGSMACIPEGYWGQDTPLSVGVIGRLAIFDFGFGE